MMELKRGGDLRGFGQATAREINEGFGDGIWNWSVDESKDEWIRLNRSGR